MDHAPARIGPRSTTRLQRLVEANQLIVAERSLDAVLQRVVDAARDLLGVEHAALGLRGPDGVLERLVSSGQDPTATGTLADPTAAAEETRRPRAVPSQPGVGTVLEVPVRSATADHGRLYLVEAPDPGGSSAEDEDLPAALAATSSIAIENARRRAETCSRQDWLQATADVGRRLLGDDGEDALDELAAAALRVAGADGVMIILPVPHEHGTLEISVAAGLGLEPLHGVRYASEDGVANQAVRTGHGVGLHDLQRWLARLPDPPPELSVLHVLVVPLQGREAAGGVLVLARTAGTPFTEIEIELAEGFATQAALALELVDVRADQREPAVLEERSRISRELDDDVLRRLFAAGLTVQHAAGATSDPTLRAQLTATLDSLDETIRTLRSSLAGTAGGAAGRRAG